MKLAAIASRILVAMGVALGGVASAEEQHAIRVELRQSEGGWQLVRGGEPYFIRGGGGATALKSLVAAGGNSSRTWAPNRVGKLLDEAQSMGVTVTVGIWLGQPRQGFNYNNAQQVDKQLEQVRQVVSKYKDHPAVLIWGLGNEMENGFEDNTAMWLAINNVAAMVHKVDPNHPTMNVVAEISAKKVQHINKLCPEIDIVGINSYGGAATVPKRYKEMGGVKPYIMTEFGPAGSWETTKNSFGAAPEQTSTQKAEFYADIWRQAVEAPKGACLGGYAFLWGQKQETTATWFGMLLPDGTRLGAVDALSEQWTGKAPANRCPAIKSLKIEGSDELDPGATVQATLDAADPEGDPMTVKWVLQSEAKKFGSGGDRGARAPVHEEAILEASEKGTRVKLPMEAGTYRLFVYVRDDHGGGATGNVLLHVKGVVGVPKGKERVPLADHDEANRAAPAREN